MVRGKPSPAMKKLWVFLGMYAIYAILNVPRTYMYHCSYAHVMEFHDGFMHQELEKNGTCLYCYAAYRYRALEADVVLAVNHLRKESTHSKSDTSE